MKNNIKESETHSITTRCCEHLISVDYDKQGNITRIHDTIKNGGCKANLTALMACITYIAKLGNEYLPELLDQLRDIECKSCVDKYGHQRKDVEAKSCADAISKVINIEVKKETKPIVVKNATVGHKMSSTEIKDYKSKCCNANVKLSEILPDFIGDKSETQTVGTAYYICTKCEKDCSIK